MADNLIINISSGNTATIATNQVGTAHYQIFKVAYGNTSSATMVSSTNPFPVVLSSGVTANIVNFTNPVIVVGNSAGDAVFVQGTVNIQGVSGAPLAITGGIARSYTRDSMAVYGYNGNSFIQATLVGSGGAAIGVSGGALRVSVADITVTASINPIIYIENYGATAALRIQGNTNGYPVATSVTGTVNIYDANITNGLTALYGQLAALNTNLSTLGIARPTTFVAGRLSATTGVTSLYASGYTTVSGIHMKAASANTDIIYINRDGVASVGYELDPGESIFLDVLNLNTIFVRAKTSTQVISYMAS
jgi:hypothetical protein